MTNELRTSTSRTVPSSQGASYLRPQPDLVSNFRETLPEWDVPTNQLTRTSTDLSCSDPFSIRPHPWIVPFSHTQTLQFSQMVWKGPRDDIRSDSPFPIPISPLFWVCVGRLARDTISRVYQRYYYKIIYTLIPETVLDTDYQTWVWTLYPECVKRLLFKFTSPKLRKRVSWAEGTDNPKHPIRNTGVVA